MNYINVNEDELLERTPCFEQICLPGMTESYKLHVFIHIDKETYLRTVMVCDQNSDTLKKELMQATSNIHREFTRHQIHDAIDTCESDMFSRISKFAF